VRIVGGTWRSRMLSVPNAQGLRPTPDRVRETVFNWLGQTLDGWRCLDLFAGSGILGFEAASRGAERVVLVERNARVISQLQAAAEQLNASQVEVRRGNALEFARHTQETFDLVLLDPPYNQGWLARVEPFLERILAADGWLYVESESPQDTLGNWHTVRHGEAGQVRFHLMRRGQAE